MKQYSDRFAVAVLICLKEFIFYILSLLEFYVCKCAVMCSLSCLSLSFSFSFNSASVVFQPLSYNLSQPLFPLSKKVWRSNGLRLLSNISILSNQILTSIVFLLYLSSLIRSIVC